MWVQGTGGIYPALTSLSQGACLVVIDHIHARILTREKFGINMQAPDKIILHKRSRILELGFGSQNFKLGAEYLRVHSPSAEVRGHGPGQERLPLNKSQVAIVSVEPQGQYAIKLHFDDGHNSGIYTWEYLADLGLHYEKYWQEYLDKREKLEASADTSAVTWVHPPDLQA